MAQRPGAPAPDTLDAELAEAAGEAAPAAVVTGAGAPPADEAAMAAAGSAFRGASSSSNAAPAADGQAAQAATTHDDDDSAPTQRRPRVAVASVGTQADEEPEGWQAFSLGRALKLLHNQNLGVV